MTYPINYTPYVFFYGRNDSDPLTGAFTGTAVKQGLAISVTADKSLRVNWRRVGDYVDMHEIDWGQIPEIGPFATREEIREHSRRTLDFQTRVFAAALLALRKGLVEEIKD